MHLRTTSAKAWVGMCLAAALSAHCGPGGGGGDGGNTDASTLPDATTTVTGSWAVVPSGTMVDLLSVWGSGPNEVLAVGNSVVRRYDGMAWSMADMPMLALRGVSGTGMGQAWAVGLTIPGNGSAETGRAAIRRLNGAMWSDVMPNSMGQLSAVWARAANDAWAVGDRTVLHWDGMRWSEVNVGMLPETLNAVWGAGNHVWAVGSVVLHFDGMTWTLENTGASGTYFNGVWASGPDDVWIVGVDGAARHYDGSRWTDLTAGANTLMAVWGRTSNDVWAVGVNGTILHWNGAGWMPVPAPMSAQNATLRAIWGLPDGSQIWAVGERGVTLRYRP
jgi:hypothetical protein